MTSSDTRFQGSIPRTYDELLGPLLFEPYALDLAARLGEITEGAVLETAAGTGRVTRALSSVLPSRVRILATDLNEAMLEVARTRVNAPSVTFRQADAAALPFRDTEFDAVVCQFGVMFMDKGACFREAKRVLRRGGRFVFNVWDCLEQNEVSKVVHDACGAMFPDDPPRFYERVPFAYRDEARIREDLTAAGFEDIAIEVVDKVTRAPSAEIAAIGLCRGTPLFGELQARGRVDEAVSHVARALAAQFGSASFDNRMRALVVSAR